MSFNVDAKTLEEWVAKGLVTPEDAGLKKPAKSLPVAKPQKEPVKAELTARLSLSILISPLALKSEANAGGKLRDKIARKSAVKAAVIHAMPDMRFPLPVVVKLTRIGQKRLDDDNLRMALKAVRDCVAAWLGLRDDSDPRVRWEYDQRPGYVGGCLIRIKSRQI
jgi:hypothetical protein